MEGGEGKKEGRKGGNLNKRRVHFHLIRQIEAHRHFGGEEEEEEEEEGKNRK